MNAQIYSRKEIEFIITEGAFPTNTAVICFYDRDAYSSDRVDYSDACDSVMYIELDDLNLEDISDSGFTYDTFFSEADKVTEFIINAYNNGVHCIICQCKYGQSRSAGCAAAIEEYFHRTGINIFKDYRYYPNKLIYNKIFDALHALEKRVDYHI